MQARVARIVCADVREGKFCQKWRDFRTLLATQEHPRRKRHA